MELHNCNINIVDCDDTIMGGGILPYSVFNGEIKVLLAQERQVMHWRGSLKWSGFEGGRKVGESILKTVCREFHEESLAVIGEKIPFVSLDSIERIIREKKYAMCIGLRVKEDNNKQQHREHLTFLVRIDYDENLCRRFEDIRYQLILLQKMFDKFHSIIADERYPDYNKKYKGVDIDTIEGLLVNKQYMFIDIKTTDGVLVCIKEYVNEKYASRIVSKMCILRSIKSFFNLHPNLKYHPSITCPTHIHRSHLNCDFLEKKCIRFWSISDLRQVINNGGFLDSDVFRAYFIPVIQLFLQNTEYLVDRPNTLYN